MNNDFLSAKLKFIGKIKPNDKINVKHLYIQPNNILSKISRSFVYHDERENALSFVYSTIEKTLEMINNTLMEPQKDIKLDPSKEDRMLNIVIDLKNAIYGIKNLALTYSDDKYFCCKIEVLVQDINSTLKSMSSKFSFLSQIVNQCGEDI
jgi:hypothetical protein